MSRLRTHMYKFRCIPGLHMKPGKTPEVIRLFGIRVMGHDACPVAPNTTLVELKIRDKNFYKCG